MKKLIGGLLAAVSLVCSMRFSAFASGPVGEIAGGDPLVVATIEHEDGSVERIVPDYKITSTDGGQAPEGETYMLEYRLRAGDSSGRGQTDDSGADAYLYGSIQWDKPGAGTTRLRQAEIKYDVGQDVQVYNKVYRYRATGTAHQDTGITFAESNHMIAEPDYCSGIWGKVQLEASCSVESFGVRENLKIFVQSF